MRVLSALVLCILAAGQQTASAQAPGGPATAAPAQSAAATCREAGRKQGLKGDDLAAHMLVCNAQARLDCAKSAVDRKLPRTDYKTFMAQCIGGKS